MNFGIWISSITGLIILIGTDKIIMPFYYFLSKTMRNMGSPASVQLTLDSQIRWGFYIMGFCLLILPIIVTLWKREETAEEWG